MPSLTNTEKITQLVCAQIAEEQKTQNTKYPVISVSSILGLPEDPRPPVIHNLLDIGDSLMITGSTGVGKTLLVSQIAIELARGETNLFGIENYYIPKPHNVLFIQSEINLRNFQKRLKDQIIQYGDGNFRDRIIFPFVDEDLRLWGDLLGDFGSLIEKYIEENKIDVVIIDPLISYHSAQENDNVNVRKALDTITNITKRHDVSFILVHHHGKLDLEGHYAARGASAISDWAGSILTLRVEDDKTENTTIKVNVSKIRHFAKTPDFYIVRKKASLLFASKHAEGVSTIKMVIDALKKSGGKADSQKALSELLQKRKKMSRMTAINYINAAVNAGLVIEKQIGTGKTANKEYFLADKF